MQQRFMALWFCYLKTDWITIRKPELTDIPFVFSLPDHNCVMITAANNIAQQGGVLPGMRLADAKAILPSIEVLEDKPAREEKLLKSIAEWCIRYTPLVALNLPDGLLLNITGCTHLWGNEAGYVADIISRFKSKGYVVKAAVADTIGTAWALSRYTENYCIVEPKQQRAALCNLPPAALRLDAVTIEKLDKLGFLNIESVLKIPLKELRRRFGGDLILRILQALGDVEEYLKLIKEPEPYQERLHTPELIKTRTGIDIAVQKLLKKICERLTAEGNGVRTAILSTYRTDGKIQHLTIGTNKATYDLAHLFKLFELRLSDIKPGMGIELFVLQIPKIDKVDIKQQAIWKGKINVDDNGIIQLLDKVAGKIGIQAIYRYLPQENYWPERAIKNSQNIKDIKQTPWRTDLKRPVNLLKYPQPIQVSAPIPDYAPMLFRYKGEVHHVKRSDGPERIEREWWLDEGEHRDYYIVEDQNGYRYWIFRSGHYDKATPEWYLHGHFA